MTDTGLSNVVVNDKDAFASCEFDGGSVVADDSFSFSSENEMEDVDVRVNNGVDNDSLSSYNEDFESQDDVEGQPEKTPRRFSYDFEDDRSSSTSSVYIQPKRSGYAARRCEKVDKMTQRLMIHADDYYNNRNRKSRRRSLLMLGCGVFALGALAATGVVLALRPQLHPQPTNDDPVLTPVASEPIIPDAEVEPTLEPAPDRPRVYETANMVEVPFANQHNLRFDGLLFVKDSSSPATESSSSEPIMSDHVWDGYAKTLDPITELHFTPGESNTSKHIVLTTTQPDLALSNAIDQNPTRDMASDPGIVLSIGLESNGELWLPHSTGQNILEFETNLTPNNKNHHHFSHVLLKRIYGPGDRFVLSVTHDVITLFRNDYHELVGMWQNPVKAPSRVSNPLSGGAQQQPTHAPLYAQVWFKENQSSMAVNAWREDGSDKDGH